jgi:hypothetical protein
MIEPRVFQGFAKAVEERLQKEQGPRAEERSGRLASPDRPPRSAYARPSPEPVTVQGGNR